MRNYKSGLNVRSWHKADAQSFVVAGIELRPITLTIGCSSFVYFQCTNKCTNRFITLEAFKL